MQTSTDPLPILNTLPSAEAAALAASTPLPVRAAFGPHQRQFPDPALDVMELTRPFLFRDLPGRVDAGVEDGFGNVSHRCAAAWRGYATERRDPPPRPRSAPVRELAARNAQLPAAEPEPVYLHGEVSGAFRGLLFGLLIEALCVLALVGMALLRKLS